VLWGPVASLLVFFSFSLTHPQNPATLAPVHYAGAAEAFPPGAVPAEGCPDARSTHLPVLHTSHYDAYPGTIQVPGEAPTAHPSLTPPRREGHPPIHPFSYHTEHLSRVAKCAMIRAETRRRRPTRLASSTTQQCVPHRGRAPPGPRMIGGIMPCAACGQANPPEARFCMSCGQALTRACPACGTEAPPGARFCMACAAPLEAPARPAPPPTPHPSPPAVAQPTAFANGRYQVTKFLGEGGARRGSTWPTTHCWTGRSPLP